MSSKITAVLGSPGSGTTVTALKIALEISMQKKNVILVLCDDAVPMVPLIAPSFSENKSLGHLLVQPELTQISILEHCVPAEKELYLLGYQDGENELTHGEYTLFRAQKLLSLLRDFVDYVVVDCFHEMLVNVLTAAALESADTVLRVTNADPKSMLWLKSQRPYLAEERYHYDQHINIINDLLPSQDCHTYENTLGGKAYQLPHVEDLHTQFYEFRLLEPLTGRNSKAYNAQIQKIVKEVIVHE